MNIQRHLKNFFNWIIEIFTKTNQYRLRMIIRVDIDNTICKTPGTDYKNAVPLYDRIERINNLYFSGHKIIYFSDRDNSYLDLTQKQLNMWGCKYHELQLGVSKYDLCIDDKSLNANDYF